jgi:hypothetical protein
MRIPTGTKKDFAIQRDVGRMTILQVHVILKPNNVVEKEGITKRQIRRSAHTNTNINITIMMRSRDKNVESKSNQSILSLSNQTNHPCIPWGSQPNNQSNTEAM